jgi:hypothetical protein
LLCRTIFTQGAKVKFCGLDYLANSIEEYCINKFQMNSCKGRDALEQVLERVKEEAQEVGLMPMDM